MCYTALGRFHASWNISLPMSIRRVGTTSFLLYLLRGIGMIGFIAPLLLKQGPAPTGTGGLDELWIES